MPDNLNILRLESVLEHLEVILQYFDRIYKVEDFYTIDGGMIQDALLMRLQVLGEGIKTINKKDPSLLKPIGEDVSLIIRFRDMLSHHYDTIKPEIIFDICTQHIARLKQQIQELLNSHK